jgi:hypothetical protein
VLIFFAWFCERAQFADAEQEAGVARVRDALSDLVPATWSRHTMRGRGWGMLALHAQPHGWRWPMVHGGEGATTVSIGLPVGAPVAAGPAGLGRALLDGQDMHTQVVPPFAALAVDRAESRFVLQQDWLGMARVFEARTAGVVAFSTRPSLLPVFFAEPVTADMAGWSRYAASGHFGGDSSPIGGTRLLGPGERVRGRLGRGGYWAISRQRRENVDDFVSAGLAARGDDQGAVRAAADGLTRIAASVAALRDGPVTLGLSGGKDSRLVAASLIAAGVMPLFRTNEDSPSDGQTARTLTDILTRERGLHVDHQFFRAGSAQLVHGEGLRERVRRLQRYYDYQYPSTFFNRPAVPPRMRDELKPPWFSGAGGEIATGYWYPKQPAAAPTRRQLQDLVATKLSTGTPRDIQTGPVQAGQQQLAAASTRRAFDLGVRDHGVLDYAYLVERMRRWSTSAYDQGIITPFISPDFVQAAFALPDTAKRARRLHIALLERLVPEWAPVPFVSTSARDTTATRVWDGDGLATLTAMLDELNGPLAGLLDLDAFGPILDRAAADRPANTDHAALRQLAALAVASTTLGAPSRPARGALLRTLRPAELRDRVRQLVGTNAR